MVKIKPRYPCIVSEKLKVGCKKIDTEYSTRDDYGNLLLLLSQVTMWKRSKKKYNFWIVQYFQPNFTH